MKHAGIIKSYVRCLYCQIFYYYSLQNRSSQYEYKFVLDDDKIGFSHTVLFSISDLKMDDTSLTIRGPLQYEKFELFVKDVDKSIESKNFVW